MGGLYLLIYAIMGVPKCAMSKSESDESKL